MFKRGRACDPRYHIIGGTACFVNAFLRTPLHVSFLAGVHTAMSALSVAPTRAREYTQKGWKYVKDLAK